uniref:G-protein coupled receptors family 1 profile domain-containing protein n=1 Tax=Gadus morhua TaxID=8049 RepID=A0A8C4ZQ93_GADMO
MGSHLEDDSSFISNIPVAMDITVAVVYSVFGVCSLFGNSMLLYVSYKKKHLLKPPEYFIVNLAVSDLGLTLSLYPMAISSSLYHRWLYGKTVCYLYAFCGMLFGICSLTTLTLLSMVCFVKVCHPLYGNRFNSWHGRGLMGCAWAYALLFASAPLARWGEYGPEPYGTACCIDWRRSNQHTQARSYTVALFLFCYILPCCAIVTSYWAIMARLRDSQRTMERHSARPSPHMSSLQAVIVKLSVAICMGFFAAWSPYAIVSMWAAFGHVDAIPPLAFALPAMLAKSSTIYNPAIYLMLRPNFRRVLRRDLGFLWRFCLSRAFQTPPPPPPPRPAPQALSRSDKRGDAFECFRHCRHRCRVCHPGPQGHEACECPSGSDSKRNNKRGTLRFSQVNCVPTTVAEKRTSDIENLHINLEMICEVPPANRNDEP